MTEIQCPRCGREAVGGRGVWSTRKPYCPACGWNVDRANTFGGKNQKQLAFFFITIVLLVVGLGLAPGGASRQHPGSVMAFALILVVMAAISWHRSKSQKSTQVATPSGASPVSRASTTNATEVAASFERLRMLRRQRTIRLKTSLRIFVTVYVILLGSAGYGVFLVVQKGAKSAANKAAPNVIPLAIFALIWAIVAFTMFRSIIRDRSLLSDGEIAIATVTSQSYAGGENRESRIAYEFKDAGGRTFSGKGTDRTRKIFEEMQTPVFYDSMNPARSVPLVGATYDVVES